MALDIRAVVLVVQKDDLTSEGYKFKKSFYKNLHGKIERHLLKTHPIIDIVADRHGRSDFMASFEQYISRANRLELFPAQTFRFGTTTTDPLIQMADFIAGSVAHAHERDKAHLELRKLVYSEPKLELITFPTVLKRTVHSLPSASVAGVAGLISESAVHGAKQFISENESSIDDVVRDQVKAVRYLLNHFLYVNEQEYVPTEHLLSHLALSKEESLTKDAFRRLIIAKIRDAGVLISSRSQPPYGYKLPGSEQDMDNFLDHYASIILPMLSRVKLARDTLIRASLGEVDVLSPLRHIQLRRLFETTENEQDRL